MYLVAHRGPIPYGNIGEYTVPVVHGTVLGRTILGGRMVQVRDLQVESAEFPEGSEIARQLGHRTTLSVPLSVISRSPTDIQPVLDTVAESAARLTGAQDASILRRDGDRLLRVAHHGPIPFGPAGDFSLALVRGMTNGRSVLDAQTVHVADLQSEVDEFPEGSATARQFGFRTALNVPLLREGVAIGSISLRRTDARALHRASGRPPPDLRRSGRHRHRERSPVHRAGVPQ